MHSKLLFALLTLFTPLVAATFPYPGFGYQPPKPKQPSASDCKKTEFWWGDKKCCLPIGGQPKPPSPPKGSNCPPHNYQWNNDRGCCVPKNPIPPNPAPPQCPTGWKWTPALWRCSPIPTPPTPPPSNPSPKPGPPKKDEDCDENGNPRNGGNKNGGKNNVKNNGHRRRNLPKSRLTLCPTGLDACPITTLEGDYECVDFESDLESCGGCASTGAGQDCTAIEGARSVGCNQGVCVVYDCAKGFELGSDGKSCNASNPLAF